MSSGPNQSRENGNDLRAGDYVFGRMNEEERRRAERDLETDADFRARVARIAASLGEQRRSGGRRAGDEAWREVAVRLATLPHLRRVLLRNEERRHSPIAPQPRPARRRNDESRRRRGRLLAMLAIAVLAGFLLGLLAARLPL
jgi:anti-sigma-K factor RskA